MNGKCLTVCLILIGICLSTVLGDLHDEIEEAENASNDGFEEDEYASRDDEPSREERRRKRPIGNISLKPDKTKKKDAKFTITYLIFKFIVHKMM